jgi:hypothetical protein
MRAERRSKCSVRRHEEGSENKEDVEEASESVQGPTGGHWTKGQFRWRLRFKEKDKEESSGLRW